MTGHKLWTYSYDLSTFHKTQDDEDFQAGNLEFTGV